MKIKNSDGSKVTLDMNLLDWFAGQALASIATDYRFPAEAAKKAYQYAEAMVAEKNWRAKA